MAETHRRGVISAEEELLGDRPTSAPDSELSQRLLELVHAGDLDAARFREGLELLEKEHHDHVYSELLYLLCHLRFEPEEARVRWQGILAHRERMATAMRSKVDLRAAMVSYFLDTHALLENPTVIELRLLENARRFAFRDSLTGLHNYRFFREFLPREIWRSDQYNTPLSLIVADVDDFKSYNDDHGHDEGNVALSRIAVLLEECLRRVDVAVRYGGEEFVLMLPATPKTGAREVAERARLAIEREDMHRGDRLTISLGVATYPADADDERTLMRRADRAMYHAKSRGKNQVQLHGEDRRSYSRFSAALEGEFRCMRPEAHPLRTIDISGGGLRFRSDRSRPLGSLVDVTLRISASSGNTRLAGRVVESTETAPGSFEVAVRIVDMDARDRRQLGQCLHELAGATGRPGS